MINELQPDLDRSISRRFGTVADDAQVRRTAAALEANGMSVLLAADAADARRIVLGLIPDGSHVYHGASQTLEVTGIPDEIESRVATSPFARGSGAWTARPRPTRSAACPRPLT